jgi:hypothetical protein
VGDYIRLRQICLVARQLEPLIGDLSEILGLKECYRDGNVGKYGLENALLPIDTTLLEVVAPTQEGTAAGRFLDKTGERGGYMAIFACADPDARARNANAIGVRTANVIDHAPYHGVQMHPRDCRAAFIEFNHTTDSDDILGPYPPAGPEWQKAIRTDVTKAIVEVEMQSPDPADLAQHWGRIIGIPPQAGRDGLPEIALVNARFHFVPGPAEIMSALALQVTGVDAILERAKAKGYAVAGNAFTAGGIAFRLT